MNEIEIIDFLNQHDYDITKTHDARFTDQKCTPDVLNVIADCVIQYENVNNNIWFTAKDIQDFEYTVQNIQMIFKKPSTQEVEASKEYDKFFSQPLKLLAYAGILELNKANNRNNFRIKNISLMEFISSSERRSLIFLQLYIEKVLKDSNCWNIFEDFFLNQSKQNYFSTKKNFEKFLIKNTPITGKLECNRIFAKVINPLAFQKNLKGTELGRISKSKITYDMLMYNRNNFRDINVNKPKDLTRSQYEINKQKNNSKMAYINYFMKKNMKLIKEYNDNVRDGLSEIKNDDGTYFKNATQCHHIFPKNEFPEISYMLENFIMITPNQHYIEAHPDNNTQVVNRQYQLKCLLNKSRSISENLGSYDEIYSFEEFKIMLSLALSDESFTKIEIGDFYSLEKKLKEIYSKYNN